MSKEHNQNVPIEVPAPGGIFAQPWSLRKMMGLMGVFGPAAIVASVSVGAGETIVVVSAGAWTGYGLLWLVLLSCLLKGVFVTYMIGRYTAVSGESIGQRLVQLPGPRGWFLIFLLIIELTAAPLGWVVVAKPCGELFRHLAQHHLPDMGFEAFWTNVGTSLLIGSALLLGLRLSFAKLERQQIIICGILVTGTILGTLMVKPDFLKALVGAVSIGNVPELAPWAPKEHRDHTLLMLATMFGFVGGSVLTYAAYSDWVRLHRWGINGHEQIDSIRDRAFARPRVDYLPDNPVQVRRMRKLLAPLRWDVTMGSLVLFIVTAAFMLSGAAVLYPRESRFEGWSLLTEQAWVWNEIHPWLVWVYYVTIVAAMWGTLQALPEIYARVAHGFALAINPHRVWSYKRIQQVVCLYVFVVAMVVIWSNISFTILIQIAGFLLANLGVALIMMAAIYLNFKLPRPYRTQWWMLMGSVLSALVLLAVAGISGWGLAGKLFGG